MEEAAWSAGDLVALKRRGSPALLVRLAAGPLRIGEVGVLDLSGQIGRRPGDRVHWSGAEYAVVRPSLADLLGSLERGAQTISPKDALYLAYRAGVGPGAAVAEAGSGSGALTIVLAHLVGPHGAVDSFDRRSEAMALARANVERAGLGPRVTFAEREVVRDGFPERSYDAIFLDLPEPWAALDAADRALRIGGSVVAFTPTYNQLERTVRALRERRYDEVGAWELLERGLHVGDGGTRPAFEMLGHTGFLSSGRKVA